MDSNPKDTLLSQLKEGDIKAYEKLFKQHYRKLCLQAIYLLRDEMEAQDLVQNVFVNFWQKKLFMQIKTSPICYLQRTVYNKCLNEIAKRKVDNHHLGNYAHLIENDYSELDYEETQASDGIETLLMELPQQQRKAFNLVYLEDKKYQEAALEMGISINSIKTHLKLAVRVLKKNISK